MVRVDLMETREDAAANYTQILSKMDRDIAECRIESADLSRQHVA